MQPLLLPEIDVHVLSYCSTRDLGSCCATSHGMRTAGAVQWKAIARCKFPLLKSIAAAASQASLPFDYHVAYCSQRRCRARGVAEPRLDDLEDVKDLRMDDLSSIVVTYELCVARRVDYEQYDLEPPYFCWSGRLSSEPPELWAYEQGPAAVRNWEEEATRHGWSHLSIYLTRDSRTILLYRGRLSYADGSKRFTFLQKVVPDSPRYADVSWSHDPDEVAQESCMQIQPVMNIANGRFRLRAVMPDYIDDPDDGILRYVSQLDIEGLDSTTLPNEDEDDDASGDATGLSDSD